MNAPFPLTAIAQAARESVNSETARVARYVADFDAWHALIAQLPENSPILALLLRRRYIHQKPAKG